MSIARSVVVTTLIALLIFSTPAAALSEGVGTDGTITIDATDGPAVELTSTDDEIVLNGPDGSNTVDITHSAGNATFSSSSPTSASVNAQDIEGDYTRITSISAGSTDLTVNPSDKAPITISGGIETIEWRNATIGDGISDLSYSAESSASITISTDTTNTTLLAIDQSSGDLLDASNADTSGNVTFDSLPSGDHDIVINSNSSPILDDDSASPTGGNIVEDVPLNLSINVSDPDFGTEFSESVTVRFYNDEGEKIGNDTLTSNGTATTTFGDPDGGENEWYAVAEDSQSDTDTSENFVYNVGDVLRIYSESTPSQLIETDVPIRVRFFVNGEDTVIERETENGLVSLQGLPANETFVVTVRSDETDDYTYRRIIVDSLIESQDVYLLNESNPNSDVIFDLDDPTGQFPPTDTTLYVEKPITKDYDSDGINETKYQVITGDKFGSTAEFPAVLETDSRYRLRVESDSSASSRILGSFSVSGSTRVPIQIERIAPEGVDGSQPSVYGGVEGKQLAVRFLDTSDSTETVEYRVLNDSGGVIVPNTTRSSTRFADVYTLPSGNGSYTVDYTITKTDGETISDSFNAGRIVDGVTERLDADPAFLELLSYVLIIASMGLVVLVSPALAPMTGTGVATLLTVLGTVAIPAPILGIAGAISVLLPIGRR